MTKFDKNKDGRIEMSEVRCVQDIVYYYVIYNLFSCSRKVNLVFIWSTMNRIQIPQWTTPHTCQLCSRWRCKTCLMFPPTWILFSLISHSLSLPLSLSLYLRLPLSLSLSLSLSLLVSSSWLRSCPQKRTSCSVSDSLSVPALNSWLWVEKCAHVP